MVTLTGVELSRDQSHAKVFFTVLGLARRRRGLLGGIAPRRGIPAQQPRPPPHHAHGARAAFRLRRVGRARRAPLAADRRGASRPAAPATRAARAALAARAHRECPPGGARRRRPPARQAPGLTSTRALARAKRLLGARKAGHTGTLDPFATGLLPLVFGEATKFSRFLIDAPKAYDATLRLGQTTTTGDTEGRVSTRRPITRRSAQIDEVLGSFRGSSAADTPHALGPPPSRAGASMSSPGRGSRSSAPLGRIEIFGARTSGQSRRKARNFGQMLKRHLRPDLGPGHRDARSAAAPT